MKKALAIFAAVAALAPAFVSAAVSASPQNVRANNNITFTCDSLDDYIVFYKPDGQYAQITNASCSVSSGAPVNPFPITEDVGIFHAVELSADWIEEPPVGNEGDPLTYSQIILSDWYQSQTEFAVAPSGAMFSFPAAGGSLPANFKAAVSDTLGDNGLLTIIGTVLALSVVFWIIVQIRKLFPGQGSTSTKIEKLTLDEKPARRHYARRRYLDDTDDRSTRGDYLIGGK